MSSVKFQDSLHSTVDAGMPKMSAGAVKRVFDILLALLLLPSILPIVLILAVITRMDGGPAFFGHQRVGQKGQMFRCWKIRTMIPNAEAVLQQHLAENPEAAAEWARDYKLNNDPRVTRIGHFLRQTSLDELPQIMNVLMGEMSFVGPRPVTRVELEKYQGYEWCYLSVKPGVTGLWQVSGRNSVNYAERVQMDVAYLSSHSLAQDVSIILRTAGAVLKRTGK